MARAPLLQLAEISLGYGGDPLFAELSLVLHGGERLALIGRNGSGKSTLMKVIAGIVEPDGGERVVRPGTGIAYMEQDPATEGFETLGDFASAGLEEGQLFRIERAAEGLGFDPARPVATASGGERRRAALARALSEEADVLLLDEPTNHLDIAAIAWLEDELRTLKGSYIIISHDRAFLRNVADATLWIDRGAVRRLGKGPDHFEDWRDRTWAEEDLARHKLDRKIKAEARWAVEGISARRKRNMGRVRALKALRAERRDQIARAGTADMALGTATRSGKKVIELRDVGLAFGQTPIVRGLTAAIERGDRIAIAGPNGAGKTSLVKVLTGELEPDSGSIGFGTKLNVAVLDQNRAALDLDKSLWENLTDDPAVGVPGRTDQVMVRGAPRHVAGYLKSFLFDDSRLRAPVRSLSGGEKARLLLARIMARDVNVLVLDEPTNDLDVETLDLLQDLLSEFDGTAIVVSHDRDFIDRVATMTWLMPGDGRVIVCAGGWSDAQAQGGLPPRAAKTTDKAVKSKDKAPPRVPAKPASKAGLTFTETHRLEALPGIIETLEGEIGKLTAVLSDEGLYARSPDKFARATELLADRQAKLDADEAEWLELEEKREAAGG